MHIYGTAEFPVVSMACHPWRQNTYWISSAQLYIVVNYNEVMNNLWHLWMQVDYFPFQLKCFLRINFPCPVTRSPSLGMRVPLNRALEAIASWTDRMEISRSQKFVRGALQNDSCSWRENLINNLINKQPFSEFQPPHNTGVQFPSHRVTITVLMGYYCLYNGATQYKLQYNNDFWWQSAEYLETTMITIECSTMYARGGVVLLSPFPQ